MTQIARKNRWIRAVLATILFPLTLFQAAASRYTQRTCKPAGRLVDIGKRKLHTRVTGEGGPTVILEAGMGGCSIGWSLVQQELSQHATVLSYDRAGFGWSPQPMGEPTCQAYVDDLKRLLEALELKPPYLLVGHSFGGMIVRLFASRYPDDVLGIVLVDAAHECRFLSSQRSESRTKVRHANERLYKWGYRLSPLGIPRLLRKHIGHNGLPAHLQAAAVSVGYRSHAYQAAYEEFLHMEQSAMQLKEAPPVYSGMPVLVLTAGKQSEEWKQDQQPLLFLSNRVKHTIVEDSWHSIQIYRPEAVTEAALELLYIKEGWPE
ncbi:alpha/beta hydrolase [Paenibacillus sp. 1011MAR3C5]|uniref:alpha/beta fold hydrolase n=1 Tax=Paenibacillus sp. 1011MAR3C5 TaxID=1675787 RepID=UPI000E6B9F3A|nr:alpha/beta hydrolase [Paenibacillus sp. 1011MAR3C5]RJE88471.1 alpha/beta hydrolase [Paenibacillus sp. 1011MAR3C5]